MMLAVSFLYSISSYTRLWMQHMIMTTVTSANIVLVHLNNTLIYSDVNAYAWKSDFALAYSSLTLQHASVSALWQSNVRLASFSTL